MRFSLVTVVLGFCLSTPQMLFADTAQPPATCERACSSSAAGRCAAGDVTANPNGDQQCATSRIGVVSYTQLSTFGNAGSCVDRNDNNRCASGSCTSWKGEIVYGVAHRTFPLGTKMEVCNTKNGICAIARVLDRGPAAYVTNVTVDARAELGLALKMGCNNKLPATYKVLEVPGVSKTAEPSGPTQVGIEAILDAQRNGNGMGPGMTYQAANTPWGAGYVGTPPPIGSAAYSGMGAPNYGQSSAIGRSQPIGSSRGYFDSNGKWVDSAVSSSPTAAPGKPVSSIIAQPASVRRGETIVVSWTSVFMQKDACQVMFQNQEFAKGNEGFKTFKTVSSDSGTLVFQLKCQDQSGQTYTSSASSTIQ